MFLSNANEPGEPKWEEGDQARQGFKKETGTRSTPNKTKQVGGVGKVLLRGERQLRRHQNC